MKTQFPLIPFLAAGGLAMAAAQEIPQRLSSLSHEDGYPYTTSGATVMGDMLYYSRRTVTHGPELWRTDGTAEGTHLVKETIVGSGSHQPDPGGGVDGNQLYFSNLTPRVGIWKTDGTAAGTVPVVTRWPVPGQQVIVGQITRAPGGGALFITDFGVSFIADRMRLWKTDGTAEGTVSLAADFRMGQVQVAGSTIWWSAHKLWKSDGTAAGTVAAFTPPVHHADPPKIVWAMTDDAVLFTTAGNGTPVLHRLDAGGLTPLKETGIAIPNRMGPAILDGDVHFLTINGQNLQLWRSDGTEDGTTLVKTMPVTHGINPLPIIAAGGKIYFNAAPEGNPYDRDLWVSDGTEAGTLRLMRTHSGSPTAFGDRLYFLHVSMEGNHQLWKTDGTVDGTVEVADLGPPSANPQIHLGATAAGLILAGNSTVWRSDGTPAGTVAAPVGRMLAGKPIDSMTATAEGRVLFSAHDTSAGRRLWRSDGTVAGTAMLGAGPPGADGFKKIRLGTAVMLGGVCHFAADDGVNGAELWRSDGTAAGTWMVKDISPGSGSSSPESLTLFKGQVWFAVVSPNRERTLWRTDGTAEGTHAVTWVGGGTGGNLALSTRMEGHLDVRFSDSGYPERNGLWRTDGTAENTEKVTEMVPYRPAILEHGGLTYYWMDSTVWRTDGTPAGTVPLHGFPAGALLIPMGQEILALGIGYGAPGDAAYKGLWRIPTDGAPVQLRAFNNYGPTAVLGGIPHFHVTSPAADAGLWRSDGTTEGTYRLSEINISGDLVAHGGKLHFCANDGVHGEEPWVSDGTAEGTRMLADLTGDSGGSSPSHFTPAGGKVFFAATTETEGPQLYVVDAAGVPTRYDQWLDAHRADMNGRLGRGEDADDDGYTNLQEFAFGGDPADGAVRPHLSSGLVPSPGGGGDGEKHLSLTLPVRRGTVFLPGRPATGAADGVIYRILATEDLADPAELSGLLEVREDTAAPHPPHPDEDYEYRTFRLDDPVTARERAFLRVVTE